MKAVIMAGGEGRRLRPLTENQPKPMTRILGKPVIDYILALLRQNGIEDCAVTLRCCAQQITGHLLHSEPGIRLQFFEEQVPLGTAGGVRLAVRPEDGPVLVMSGDALCDFALREAMERHLHSNAAVTIVTTRVDDPREYGLVLADKQGEITGFVEKPSFAQAAGGLANTGIYILSPKALEQIPVGERYDFAEDLFPKLLAAGERLQSCSLDGYWCDIGDLAAYRKAQADLLSGRVQCMLPGESGDGDNRFCGKRPNGRYELRAPVYIGEGVLIGDGAIIGPETVLDDGCSVGAGTLVSQSVLLPRCALGEFVQARGTIICEGATVKMHASLREGSAVGEGATVGRGARVLPGIHIEGGAVLADGLTAAARITAAGRVGGRFDDEGLRGEVGIDLTPELAVQVGCAVGTLAGGRPVGIAAAEGRASGVLASALIAGVRSAGASVMDFGNVFGAMFDFGMVYSALATGIYIDAEVSGAGAFRLVCGAGLPAPRRLERQVEQLLARGEFTRAGRGGFGDCVDLSGIGVIYLSQLRRLAPDGLAGIRARVHSDNPLIERLLGDVLNGLGCEDGGEVGLHLILSQDGRRISIRQGDTRLGPQQVVAAYGLLLFDQKQDLAVENDFPRALDSFAQAQGRQVYRYLLCPADDSDAEGRRLASKQCARDGLMLAVLLLDDLRRKNLPLVQYVGRLPPIAVEEIEVPVHLSPARMLEQIAGEQTGEGILVRDHRGVVLLRPRKSGEAIRVFAEAASWETAHELCGDLADRLALLDKQTEKD